MRTGPREVSKGPDPPERRYWGRDYTISIVVHGSNAMAQRPITPKLRPAYANSQYQQPCGPCCLSGVSIAQGWMANSIGFSLDLAFQGNGRCHASGEGGRFSSLITLSDIGSLLLQLRAFAMSRTIPQGTALFQRCKPKATRLGWLPNWQATPIPP